jgi:DNA-binding transcriptional MerR regulator
MSGDDEQHGDPPDGDPEPGQPHPSGRVRPKKAPTAFRTISEVADELHIPQHVLRFWETKFTQVKPLKRGGGRRYYRPDDIGLLRRISDLLYIQGYTIKGVQRLLREGGGRLSDDIPPATPDERAQSEAERAAKAAEPELPIPGLAVPGPVASPQRAGRSRDERGLEPEVERLRTVILETLHELERLRALLR